MQNAKGEIQHDSRACTCRLSEGYKRRKEEVATTMN